MRKYIRIIGVELLNEARLIRAYNLLKVDRIFDLSSI